MVIEVELIDINDQRNYYDNEDKSIDLLEANEAKDPLTQFIQTLELEVDQKGAHLRHQNDKDPDYSLQYIEFHSEFPIIVEIVTLRTLLVFSVTKDIVDQFEDQKGQKNPKRAIQ